MDKNKYFLVANELSFSFFTSLDNPELVFSIIPSDEERGKLTDDNITELFSAQVQIRQKKTK